jgi:hypothetical protein
MIATALALLLAAPVSSPLSDAELQSRVSALLASIDVPTARDEWLALGDRAVPLLTQVARDANALPTRRSQALTALGFIGGPRAIAAASEVSSNEGAVAPVRMAAVRALAALGVPDAELARVMTTSSDARVRATAAEEWLARKPAAASCKAVAARAAAEPEALRPIYARALSRCP